MGLPYELKRVKHEQPATFEWSPAERLGRSDAAAAAFEDLDCIPSPYPKNTLSRLQWYKGFDAIRLHRQSAVGDRHIKNPKIERSKKENHHER